MVINRADDLKDPSILQGVKVISFDVTATGGQPEYEDEYYAYLKVSCKDGTEKKDEVNGPASKSAKFIHL